MSNILEVRNIEKHFKDAAILKGASFFLKENETLGIIGSNGAGKTLLTKIIVGLIEKDSGHIDSKEIKDLENEIAIQFQEPKMDISMTPNQLIEFTRRLHADKVIPEEIEEAKKIFGISKYENKKLSKLSGGQKQRVNLMLAVIRNTRILILDEFTTGLDIVSVEKILNYIKYKKEANNTSIIIISHQPEELRELTNRIILLKNGIFEKEFKTSDVESKYKGKFNKFLLENIGDENV